MSKRAAYRGDLPAVDLRLPNGNWITVEKDHFLPPEDPVSGDAIPASYRDELLKRDDFSEVKQNPNPPAKTTGKED